MDDDNPDATITNRTEHWTNADGQQAVVEVSTLWNGNEIITVDYQLMVSILTTLGYTESS